MKFIKGFISFAIIVITAIGIVGIFVYAIFAGANKNIDFFTWSVLSQRVFGCVMIAVLTLSCWIAGDEAKS